MSSASPDQVNPELDLVLERIVPVAQKLIWAAWTRPEHLKQSPEGQDLPSEGCYLEIVPEGRLVFTDALRAGFRPAENPFFTAVITIEPHAEGTRLS